MAENYQTLTVEQLRKDLADLPISAKVYLSSDPEGNSYGTIDKTYSISFNADDNVVVIYPYEESIDQEEIEPELCARVERECVQDDLAKKGEI